MPVTPAHAVVALPSWRGGRWWAAAVVAGSVAPDLSRFWPFVRDGSATAGLHDAAHSLFGALTIDLVAGVALLVAWVFLVRPTLVDVGPDVVVARLATPATRPTGWPLVLGTTLAVLAGALSHVALDAAVDRELGQWSMPVFESMSGGRILQYALSVLGVAWLGWEVVRFLRRPRHPAPRLIGPVGRALVVTALAAVAVAAGCGRLSEFASPREGIRLYGTMAFQGSVRAVSVLGLVVLVGSAVWSGGARRRRVRRAGMHAGACAGEVGAAR